MKIETKTLMNIQGKQLRYIIISNENDSHAINVGEKTFNSVNKLITDETNKQTGPIYGSYKIEETTPQETLASDNSSSRKNPVGNPKKIKNA